MLIADLGEVAHRAGGVARCPEDDGGTTLHKAAGLHTKMKKAKRSGRSLLRLFSTVPTVRAHI